MMMSLFRFPPNIFIVFLLFCSISLVSSFTPSFNALASRTRISSYSASRIALKASTESKKEETSTTSSAVSDAAAITEFMARAHEEKLRALNRAEAKYKDRIAELEAKIEELEGPKTGSEATSLNSFAFPATNKLLTEKVTAYRTWLEKYLVRSQEEKQKAVQAAEEKLITKYEALIADLKKQIAPQSE